MSTIQLGRLTLGPPSQQVTELIGDPIGATGAVVTPAARVPLTLQLQLNTILDGATTLPAAQKLRRQLRAMLSNTQLKLQGFLYFQYGDDSELNAWLVPDPTMVQSRDATAFLGAGLWESQASNWTVAGRRRTHKEARSVWLKDLRSGAYERDVQQLIVSTDFAARPALALTILPHGSLFPADNLMGSAPAYNFMPMGYDGGQCLIISGLSDLDCISFERSEAALNLSDVIVYDRRGDVVTYRTTPPAAWEEVLGVDYPWSWLSSGVADAPVLDNGLCRVRYVNTPAPGLAIDLWDGTAYTSQGIMNFQRGDSIGGGWEDTWVAAGLREYTPDRAVMVLTLSCSGTRSRDQVYVTLRRGEVGARFEVYPSMLPDNSAYVWPAWTPARTDAAQSLFSAPGNTENEALAVSSAGSGSGYLPSAILAALTSSDENWLALLEDVSTASTVGPYQTNFAVVQAMSGGEVILTVNGSTTAYSRAAGQIKFGYTGYASVAVSFAPALADQVMEAETIINVSDGTASVIADAAAAGGDAVLETQTAFTAHTLVKTTTDLLAAKYRCFVRARVDTAFPSIDIGSILANLQAGFINGTTTVMFGVGEIHLLCGYQTTSTASVYDWYDLGDALAPVPGATFFLDAAVTSLSTDVVIDRCELVLVENTPVSTNAVWPYNGARDRASEALYDSRTLGAIVAR